MIGYHRQFVFVHIPKTAGQSVSSVLRPHALAPYKWPLQWAARRIWRAEKYDLFKIRPNHSTALECRAILGPERYANFYSFAFVRNPWARAHSLYRFVRTRPNHRWFSVTGAKSFEAFLETIDQKLSPLEQIDYVTDEAGEIIVDFIGRLETIDTDFEQVRARLGLKRSLPHKNKTEGDYRLAYTARTVDMVTQMFARDIAQFGYQFE